MKKVCLVPKLQGVGGMVSFQAKLSAGLIKHGIQVCYSLEETSYESLLVIGGTRDLIGLRRARRRGVRVVQRLDGMNWIHRQRRTGVRHFLRAEYGNLMLGYIRHSLADHIVYQSQFARGWWERVYGPAEAPCNVVYNGVDLETYSPLGEEQLPQDQVRMLLVEGTLGGGYEQGLETAVQLGERLNHAYSHNIEMWVVGKVTQSIQAQWSSKTTLPLTFTGQLPGGSIPGMDRSAHFLYAADLNAACPNSVIEALACGLPVVAFDTGALAELVSEDAGRVVPYGGDPWKLEPPDIAGLASAADEVLREQSRYRQGARQRAEELFGLDKMVEGYIQALGG